MSENKKNKVGFQNLYELFENANVIHEVPILKNLIKDFEENNITFIRNKNFASAQLTHFLYSYVDYWKKKVDELNSDFDESKLEQIKLDMKELEKSINIVFNNGHWENLNELNKVHHQGLNNYLVEFKAFLITQVDIDLSETVKQKVLSQIEKDFNRVMEISVCYIKAKRLRSNSEGFDKLQVLSTSFNELLKFCKLNNLWMGRVSMYRSIENECSDLMKLALLKITEQFFQRYGKVYNLNKSQILFDLSVGSYNFESIKKMINKDELNLDDFNWKIDQKERGFSVVIPHTFVTGDTNRDRVFFDMVNVDNSVLSRKSWTGETIYLDKMVRENLFREITIKRIHTNKVKNLKLLKINFTFTDAINNWLALKSETDKKRFGDVISNAIINLIDDIIIKEENYLNDSTYQYAKGRERQKYFHKGLMTVIKQQQLHIDANRTEKKSLRKI